MKSKHLKKITLNKRSISTLTLGNVKGGATTFEPIKIDTATFQSSYCADTREDYTCGYCTVA
ncbi:hypothetical protein [Kordia sp.]|uniref:hypothetical protein n=1 Tax=Kordia sp. TaxID=1965332 RepID=UPI003D26D0EA